jgi:peptidoglycan/xylan/chitin deacetylase (PgdA/CDA1 family)
LLLAPFRPKRFPLLLCTIAVVAAVTAAAFCKANKTVPVGAGVSAVEGEIKLPVIMYHSMLKEQKRQGKYVISPNTFESDLQYLHSRGYKTITVAELVSHVSYGTPLPAKPVMLTFDDGYYNNYCYAFPLAKKYNAKIVIAPIGYYTDLYTKGDADHATYSHLTWPEISEMMSSGLVEFQNHSYNLHSLGARRGASRKRGESTDAYAAMLQKDVGQMQTEMRDKTGYTPLAFVYPFGASSKESDQILKKMGFRATFLCTAKFNIITRDPECLYSLGRFLRPSGISSRQYFIKIGLG